MKLEPISYQEALDYCESQRDSQRFCRRHNGCSGFCHYYGSKLANQLWDAGFEVYSGSCGHLFVVDPNEE